MWRVADTVLEIGKEFLPTKALGLAKVGPGKGWSTSPPVPLFRSWTSSNRRWARLRIRMTLLA